MVHNLWPRIHFHLITNQSQLWFSKSTLKGEAEDITFTFITLLRLWYIKEKKLSCQSALKELDDLCSTHYLPAP